MKYKIMMVESVGWQWYIYGTNGKCILESNWYKNKAQCRNVMKRFAKKFKIPYKEIKHAKSSK